MIAMIELGCALAVAGVATFHDLRTRTLPDALAIVTAIAGITLHAITGGAAGVLDAVFGAIACALLPAVFASRESLGWGDVKLFAAFGALLGPLAGVEVELWSFTAAFVIAIAWAISKRRIKGLGSFPFAPAMMVGVITVGLSAR